MKLPRLRCSPHTLMPRSRPLPRKCASLRRLNRSRPNQHRKSGGQRMNPRPLSRNRLAKGGMRDRAGAEEGAEAAVAVPGLDRVLFRRQGTKRRLPQGMLLRSGRQRRERPR